MGLPTVFGFHDARRAEQVPAWDAPAPASRQRLDAQFQLGATPPKRVARGGMARSSPAEKGFLRCFETRTAGASHLRFVLQGVKTGAAARGFACGIGVGYPVAEANDRGELNVMRIVPISSLWQRLRGLFQAVTGSLRIST